MNVLVLSFNYPKRERRLILFIDNIEFRLGHRDRTRLKIGSEKDIPWVVDYILLEGYAIWGNRWGYVTKLGRKARGTLKTRYGWGLVWHRGNAYWHKTRAWFKKHKQIEID